MTVVDLGLPVLGGLDSVPKATESLTAKDFTSDSEVRWCPGCGDYAILAAIRSFMPTLGIKRENTVFISGIGCSSRFPYYMDTYGMHSIHGRAPAIATGLATSRPDLSVWVVTGDGDALSIGGNHLIHALRRNVNLKILLFNNRIYGLTKGQYSPTSEVGKVTKSTPMGSADYPFDPVALALGAEATFVGRALDSDRAGLTAVLEAAAAHRGTALVEILQDCPVFNDGSFDLLRKPESAPQRLIKVSDGEPIVFGQPDENGNGTLAVVREGFGLGVRPVSEVADGDIVVHDVTDPHLPMLLARLTTTDLGHVVTGIFRRSERAVYDDVVRSQVAQAKEAAAAKGGSNLQAILDGNDTWTVA